MEIKEYLGQYQRTIKDIERKQRLLKELKEDAITLRGIDYSNSKVSKTRNKDADFVHRLTQIDNLERVIQKDIIKAQEVGEEIKRFLNAHFDEVTAFIFVLRYIDGYIWDKISLITNYNEATVRRKHRMGLRACEELIF